MRQIFDKKELYEDYYYLIYYRANKKGVDPLSPPPYSRVDRSIDIVRGRDVHRNYWGRVVHAYGSTETRSFLTSIDDKLIIMNKEFNPYEPKMGVDFENVLRYDEIFLLSDEEVMQHIVMENI